MTVDLSPMTSHRTPKPRMVYLHREMALGDRVTAMSYLVRSHNDRMLMLRYSFSRNGHPSRMEVSEMDIEGRRVIPLHGIGNNAVSVGIYMSMWPRDTTRHEHD
jgi:hypothetical protein